MYYWTTFSNHKILFHDYLRSLKMSVDSDSWGRGSHTIQFNISQSFITTFSHLLAIKLKNKHWSNLWVICIYKLAKSNFKPIILIYRRGNFVYHNLKCTLIYHPLSYPIRSLTLKTSCLSVEIAMKIWKTWIFFKA